MKSDWKLLTALAMLIGLVAWLLVISYNRNDEMDKALQEFRQAQSTATIPQVINGKTPVYGVDYRDGRDGQNGLGASGPSGTPGPSGPAGQNGSNGSDGLSAFDIAVKNGFVGTQQQWLESLKVKGDKGDRGDDIQLECVSGLLVKKFTSDDLWNVTNIKCEVAP